MGERYAVPFAPNLDGLLILRTESNPRAAEKSVRFARTACPTICQFRRHLLPWRPAIRTRQGILDKRPRSVLLGGWPIARNSISWPGGLLPPFTRRKICCGARNRGHLRDKEGQAQDSTLRRPRNSEPRVAKPLDANLRSRVRDCLWRSRCIGDISKGGSSGDGLLRGTSAPRRADTGRAGVSPLRPDLPRAGRRSILLCR